MDHGDVVSSMVGGHAARNTLGATKMSVDLHFPQQTFVYKPFSSPLYFLTCLYTILTSLL